MKTATLSACALHLFSVLGVLAATLAIPVYASGHARVHTWSQDQGNLLLNWSFENPLEFWRDDSLAGVRSLARVASGDAVSGRFTAKLSGTSTSSMEQLHLLSPHIPVVPGQNYTLSFHVRSDGGVTGGAAPAVLFYETLAVPSGLVFGTSHRALAFEEWGSPQLNWWTLQRLIFTVPAGVTRVRISLWGSVETGTGGTLHFDDVVLEEGALSETEVFARRAAHGYSVSYHDGLGRLHQTQTPVPENASFVHVEGVEYDSAGRIARVPLPTPVQSPWPPAFVDDLVDSASWYHGTLNPFTEPVYAPDPTARVIETAPPGEAWALSGGRTLRSGFRFVAGLAIPASIETASHDPAERPYLLEWNRDEDSTFTMRWLNRRGQVVQTARQVGPAPSSAFAFAITRTTYTPAGLPRRVLTPLDVASSGSGFAETFVYNAQGLLTSRFGPDRGLEKYWYDKEGRLRYAQDEEQRTRGTYFTYYDHDAHGNLLSTGEQFLYNPPYPAQEQIVDGPGELGIWGKEEHRGFVYGGLSAFESRTGIPLDSLDGDLASVPARPFVLSASWHRNPAAAEVFGAKAALVAEFPHYDARGRVTRRHLWLGTSKSAPLQSVRMEHDTLGRMRERVVHEGLGITSALMQQGWVRDALGRITAVSGLYGDTLVRYTYAYDGRLETVWLGDDDEEEDNGIEIHHGHHVRGWVKDIEAVSLSDYGRPVFRQVLGYESRALNEPGVPALDAPRFGGQISQQLYWYLWDVENSLRVVNYTYDAMGRMTTADYRHGQGLFGYAGNLVFPVSFSDVNALDTRLAYDLNGRITGKRGGGVSSADSAVYAYNWNSYQLNHVQGKLSSSSTRNASGYDNFAYDVVGRLTQDRSKGLQAEYSHEGLATSYRTIAREDEVVLHPLYDASGYRVSQVETRRLAARFPVYWAGTTEGAEPAELYTASNFAAAWADASYRLNVLHYPAPDTVTVYVVADSGMAFTLPDTSGYGLYKGAEPVPVVIRGVEKYSAAYNSLVAGRAGRVISSRHWANFGGSVVSAFTEYYDTTGGVSSRDVVVPVFGRGVPVGRYLAGADSYQFFIKNHLGSTMRVVEGDGSYDTSPVLDYQAYGERQAVRADTVGTPGHGYTGKELDTEVNLYYFGARWYDAELGTWTTPDAYREFFNPYGRSGNPIRYVDADGNCELICISIIVGSAAGAYFGGSAANGDFNPINWDYSETWDEILTGAAIGGTSGGIGAWVALPATAGGLGWGATAGMATSSTVASGLGNLDDMARGRDPRGLSTNFGAFDVRWGAKDPFDWNNPFDDDPWHENVGDALGWFANVQDVGNALAPSPAEANASAAKKGEGLRFPMLTKDGRGGFERSNYIGPGGTGIPKDMSDYFAYLHDLAYQKHGASGLRGLLFNNSVIGADIDFVMAQLKMAGGFTRGFDAYANTMIGWRQMLNGGFYGAGLGAFAAPKIINTVGQGAFNNGY